MPRFVGRLERLLELAKALAVEAERVGRLVEARTLFERDDAVLDDLREDLFVMDFELTEPEVAADLPLLERPFVLERELLCRHAFAPFRMRPRTSNLRSLSSGPQEPTHRDRGPLTKCYLRNANGSRAAKMFPNFR